MDSPLDTLAPQMPLTVPAALDYAEQVMSAREAGIAGLCRAVFAYGPDPLQAYDVWSRPGLVDAPVLVFWHGGGWTNGYRQWSHFMARHVVSQGLVFVTPGYRLAPRHRMPDIEADALALLGHLAQSVPGCGGSPRRLLLSGHSAGGHIAALAALRLQHDRTLGIDADSIVGCLPVSAILDLHHPSPEPDSLEDRVYTMVLDEPRTDSFYSPLCWTAGNAVPMVLTCGARDTARVLSSNRRAAALLAQQPGPATLHVLAGHDHFATHLALADGAAPWYAHLRALVAARSHDVPSTTRGST